MQFALYFVIAMSMHGTDINQFKQCKADADCTAVMGVCSYQAVNKRYAEKLRKQWEQESKDVSCFFNESLQGPPPVACINQICERK